VAKHRASELEIHPEACLTVLPDSLSMTYALQASATAAEKQSKEPSKTNRSPSAVRHASIGLASARGSCGDSTMAPRSRSRASAETGRALNRCGDQRRGSWPFVWRARRTPGAGRPPSGGAGLVSAAAKNIAMSAKPTRGADAGAGAGETSARSRPVVELALAEAQE
jgi:hypothetical protein